MISLQLRLKTLSKYASLLYTLMRVSLMADLEYRMNIAVKIFTDFFWYATQLMLFEFLFRHVPMVSGWTLPAVRVFMGVLFIVDGFWMVFFSENLDNLSDKVQKGTLDLLLTKPVNAQFMISFQKLNTPYLINVGLSALWLIWAISRLEQPVPWPRVLILMLCLPFSICIIYCIKMFFSTLSFLFTRIENINYVWYQIYRLGTRPDALYPPWLRYTILTLLPVGFIASVPARVLVEGPNFELLALMVSLATLLFVSIRVFWRYALKRYASASS
jgi:ABC-2 type transport system permease protein